MTIKVEEGGPRPGLWEYEKYTEIYLSPIAPMPTIEEIGAVVATALKDGPVVIIKGVPSVDALTKTTV